MVVSYIDSQEHAVIEQRLTAVLRDEILERDNNQCQVCGTGGENRLQLHHVKLRSQGGRHGQDNLVTVCFKCHAEIHAHLIEIVLIEVWPGRYFAFCKRPSHRRQA